jgi:hypothetical protein
MSIEFMDCLSEYKQQGRGRDVFALQRLHRSILKYFNLKALFFVYELLVKLARFNFVKIVQLGWIS